MKRVSSGKGPIDELTEELDGVSGDQEIANKFKEVYNSLYNKSGSEDSMKGIKSKIKTLTSEQDSMKEITKVTASIVKEAVTKMKPDKRDVTGGFTSDCLLHAPDSMFVLLASIFRSWLIHGEVSASVLVPCWLVFVSKW